MAILGQEKKVNIRKARRCFGCLRKFDVGTEMTRVAFTDNGSVHSTYTCDVCEAVFAEWERYDQEEGYYEGGVREACPETWEDMRKEMEGEQNAALAGCEEVGRG